MSIPYKRIVSKSAVSLIVDTALNDASYSTATDATAEIISLPSSTIERSELKMTVKGNTVVNILPDAVAGCESTDGWTTSNASVATDNSNEYEGTNCLKATISSTVGTIRYDAISLLDKTKYYLISAYIKNGNATNVRLGFNTDDVDVDSSTVAATTYTRVGVVVQPTDFDTASFVYLQLRVDGANTQYGYIDALMVNEISAAEYALGATALLAKYAWHLNDASTERVEITSTGKNLFDAVNNTAFNSYATRKLEEGRDCWCCSHSNFVTTTLIENVFAPSTQYTISGYYKKASDSAGYLMIYFQYSDGTHSSLLLTSTSFAQFTRTSTAGKTVVKIYTTPQNSGNTYFDINTLQLEKSTSATTYEAYKSTTVKTPVTLRSVSSTIYDTFDVQTGIHMKNVDIDTDVSDTQYDSLDKATYTNVDVIKTTAFSTAVAGTAAVDGFTKVINSSGVLLSEIAAADIDNATSVGKYYYHTDKTVWFIVAADTYADIAAARTGLGTSQVLYKLLTPTQTTYPPQVLQAHVNGTVTISDISTAGTIPTISYSYATTVKGQMDDNADMIERASQNNWGAWTPTVTWTTGTPEGSVAQTARYTVINNTCYFNYSYTATDGNDASALTITLPMTPKDNNAIIVLQAQQKVNTTWTNPLAYIDDDSGGIAFRSLSACTNAQAVEVIVTGFYEV